MEKDNSIPDDVKKQIEAGVKEIAKKSTAPDKETPDWMESDIRRGAEFGYNLASRALSDLKAENEKLHSIINDVDSFLSNMEDCLHGEDGKQITFLRKKIGKFKNQ